jgi:hypothetical protein
MASEASNSVNDHPHHAAALGVALAMLSCAGRREAALNGLLS